MVNVYKLDLKQEDLRLEATCEISKEVTKELIAERIFYSLQQSGILSKKALFEDYKTKITEQVEDLDKDNIYDLDLRKLFQSLNLQKVKFEKFVDSISSYKDDSYCKKLPTQVQPAFKGFQMVRYFKDEAKTLVQDEPMQDDSHGLVVERMAEPYNMGQVLRIFASRHHDLVDNTNPKRREEQIKKLLEDVERYLSKYYVHCQANDPKSDVDDNLLINPTTDLAAIFSKDINSDKRRIDCAVYARIAEMIIKICYPSLKISFFMTVRGYDSTNPANSEKHVYLVIRDEGDKTIGFFDNNLFRATALKNFSEVSLKSTRFVKEDEVFFGFAEADDPVKADKKAVDSIGLYSLTRARNILIWKTYRQEERVDICKKALDSVLVAEAFFLKKKDQKHANEAFCYKLYLQYLVDLYTTMDSGTIVATKGTSILVADYQKAARIAAKMKLLFPELRYNTSKKPSELNKIDLAKFFGRLLANACDSNEVCKPPQ